MATLIRDGETKEVPDAQVDQHLAEGWEHEETE